VFGWSSTPESCSVAMIDADHWVWSTKRENECDIIKPTKFCRQCGAKIAKDSGYCEECGTRLDVPVAPPIAPQSEVAQKCPQYGTVLPSVGWFWYDGKHICQRCAENIRREMPARFEQEDKKRQMERRTRSWKDWLNQSVGGRKTSVDSQNIQPKHVQPRMEPTPEKFCRECGAKIPRSSKHCEECEMHLSDESESPTESSASSEPMVEKNMPYGKRDILDFLIDRLRKRQAVLVTSSSDLDLSRSNIPDLSNFCPEKYRQTIKQVLSTGFVVKLEGKTEAGRFSFRPAMIPFH
jgi:predicted amidophosphoribosyltransferase